MAKRQSPEDQLSDLIAAFETAASDARVSLLEAAIGARSNFVVEHAAKMVVEHEVHVDASVLMEAWRRFARNEGEDDKNCRAKLPVVEALNFLDVDEPDFYSDVMKYVQIEPVWGTSVDTAPGVRGAAALGLIRCRSASPSQTLLQLVELLSDKEPAARVHAATAIGQTGLPAVTPLLRLKVRSGDVEAEVIGECFRGLLDDSLATNLDFVADYLNSSGDVSVEAAAALAATRRDEVIEKVIQACETCSPQDLDGFYLSLGLARTSAAIDYLLQRISDDLPTASAALKALHPSRFYPDILSRIETAVQQSENKRLVAEFERQFRDSS